MHRVSEISRYFAGVLALCLMILSAPLAQSQTEPTVKKQLPAAMLNPWRIMGINAEEVVQAKPSLDRAYAAMTGRLLRTPQTLTQYVSGVTQISNNLKRRTDKIVAGTPTINTSTPIVAEPVWCSIMDQHLFFVTISDAEKNVLLASSHSVISNKQWDKALKAKNLGGLIQRALQGAAAKAMSGVGGQAQASDALHVGLSLGRETTRRDEGSSLCLNMLVAEKLAPNFTVIRPVGGDHLMTARRALDLAPKLRRQTRTVILRWLADSEQTRLRTLPMTYTLKATYAETVRGQNIPPKAEEKMTFALGGNGLNYTLPQSLIDFLNQEKGALTLADMPRISKIYRAWAYLDKGRAWGLRMNDRLITRVGGKKVKGHVVKFFGPAENIKSPRGYRVYDGAILYIRKGQRDVSIGQEFKYDETTFPTPWPPGGGK